MLKKIKKIFVIFILIFCMSSSVLLFSACDNTELETTSEIDVTNAYNVYKKFTYDSKIFFTAKALTNSSNENAEKLNWFLGQTSDNENDINDLFDLALRDLKNISENDTLINSSSIITSTATSYEISKDNKKSSIESNSDNSKERANISDDETSMIYEFVIISEGNYKSQFLFRINTAYTLYQFSFVGSTGSVAVFDFELQDYNTIYTSIFDNEIPDSFCNGTGASFYFQ